MYTRVDWISFTFQADTSHDPRPGEEWKTAVKGITRCCVGLRKWLDAEADWSDGAGRAPFQKSLRASNIGVSLFYGHKKNLVLCEISGVGCQRLLELNAITTVLSKVAERVTRLDIACDFKTDVKPVDFAALRDTGRFKTYSEMTSQTGDTVYVGARSSDRYARVYRYNPPHPRSDFLRCEFVARDEQAKELAQYIVTNGVGQAAIALGTPFGWSHPLWLNAANEDVEELEYRQTARGGNTVHWLYAQVLPAVEKLIANSQREDVEQFVAALNDLVYTEAQRNQTTPNE